ncbi:MAG: phosphodiester glycosidase family protein [Aristaeellaceae bacterium]
MNVKLITGLMTLLFSLSLMQWQEPCVPEPHAYTYQDSERSIVINTIEVDKSVGYVVDVQLRSASGFHVASPAKGIGRMTAMLKDTGAVLAVNADNYRSHGSGVIIRDGVVLRRKSSTRHLMSVYPDGSLQVITDRKAETPSALSARLLEEGVLHTFEFGPLLVENGQAVTFPKTFKLITTNPNRREPRTAIGMISPLHYVIVVVDGRRPGYSEGISLQTLQSIFVELGVQTAFNLDGGGSTELWFQGEIINRPSGKGERGLSDCIWF